MGRQRKVRLVLKSAFFLSVNLEFILEIMPYPYKRLQLAEYQARCSSIFDAHMS